MSEPTKESLIRAACLRSKVAHAMTQKGWGEESANQVLALEFDAIRAEEREKAEKLAEALRKTIGWAMLADDNDPWYFGEGREPDFEPDMKSAKAALSEWERSKA